MDKMQGHLSNPHVGNDRKVVGKVIAKDIVDTFEKESKETKADFLDKVADLPKEQVWVVASALTTSRVEKIFDGSHIKQDQGPNYPNPEAAKKIVSKIEGVKKEMDEPGMQR